MKVNNKKIYIYLPILFSVIFILGIILGTKFASISSFNNKIFSITSNKYNKVNTVINYIQQDYVDSVSKNDLEKEAINGMLQHLDPHSVYITAKDFNDINDPLMGNFEGIGIEFRIIKDTISIIHTITGGPSEKVGIIAGDKIIKINDKNIAGIKISTKDIIRKLKGKKGTKVKLSIFRRGVLNLLNFTITRDIIPTYSINADYMINDSIAYIKLSKFSATTNEEFIKAVDTLRNKGMKELILDLRGNSGGYLRSAIDLADEFLEKGKLVVYTEGDNRPRKYFYATGKGDFEKEPLVILIDGGSASASEILAGAIQDNDRGLIIGRRSFGKGLVQEQLNLGDGSAILLTVARYHTPTGRCIQRPYNKGIAAYYNEYYNRFVDGEMEHPDSIHFADSLKYTTPKGRIVYGGGGIMPDIYVPIQSGKNYKYFNDLINKGLVFQYAFNYTDINRKKLHNFKTFKNFDKNFIINDSTFNDFIRFANKNRIKRNIVSTKNNADKEIKNLLKAFIARDIFDDKGFYPIYNKTDKIFLKAVEVLNSKNKIKLLK